jgi:MauM/NapG family ferredoxin protein
VKSVRRAKRIVWVRRVAQTVVLLLFLGLLLATRDSGEGRTSGPLALFFDLDPLILLSTWLSTHALAGLSLLALATVGLTVLLGRVFCGWICPFGTLHNMVGTLRRKFRRLLPRTEAFSRWQRAKYFLLFALLVMALGGAHWIGVFDPFSLLYRSLAVTVLPVLQYAVEEGSTAIYLADPHLGSLHLTAISEPVYRFLRDHLFGASRQVFSGSAVIFLLLIAALALNLYRPRFWCRYVCPLGALLGLCAKRTMLRLSDAQGECDQCGLCTIRCPAAAQPEKRDQWLPSECFGCWNCVAACKNGGIDFRFAWPWRRPRAGTVDLKKRAALTAVLGGVGGLLLLRMTPQAQALTYHPGLIRPPGARPEPDFLRRCIQCGMCMKVCPPNGLHPTWHEAGIEGVWTPMLVPRIGYCEYECHLCGQVCPTGAIAPLSLEAKKRVKIGLAAIDTTRCLPYAYGRDCIVCEEHCPIPTKAIYFVEKEIALRDGSTRVVKQPKVDPDLCTGCGICENKCPFRDRPAIFVTSANEGRHAANQPILPSLAAPDDGDAVPARDSFPAGEDPYR